MIVNINGMVPVLPMRFTMRFSAFEGNLEIQMNPCWPGCHMFILGYNYLSGKSIPLLLKDGLSPFNVTLIPEQHGLLILTTVD